MFKPNRRKILLGGGAIIGVAALMSKPRNNSGPRDPYFLQVQSALTAAKIATPTLVVDRARLQANIDTLVGHLPEGMGYRIVSKSLPSIGLLKYIRERSGSDRLMTFNQPMLTSLSKSMPEANQLLGKPLPVQAARNYFESLGSEYSGAQDNVQWLIDTPQRLDQYLTLAKILDRPVRINLELDVGLHRGGFEPGAELQASLERIQAEPLLLFSGFMGYEPHIPALPEALGWREKALRGAWKVYQASLDQAVSIFGSETVADSTRNAAGSPTYRYYKDIAIANEISAGSCLVKPTHFDSDLLQPHLPASFIATPVIKSLPTTRMPGLEFADPAKRVWDPNYSKTVFIYGGHWLADPVDPPGLDYNPTFGRSSNQEMLNGGPDLDISVDEFVFFRPHQSEAVFLQFGDIAVYEDGEIVEYWPVFEASA